MKLVIQIPCLNEEQTLPAVLREIPKKIKGVDSIEVVVIDDGCSDKTVEVAKAHGVRHIVHHSQKQGLARSFRDGLMASLALDADIIVNTDGDNQYPSTYIPALIAPILDKKADIVIGNRQTDTIDHFSPTKKRLQKLGTRVLNAAAGTNVPDAPSGFRAYSRDAAIRLNVVTNFSYAMETLIQAGRKGLAIGHVPIRVNPKTRESRLFRSTPSYLAKSGVAIGRAFVMYRPYVIFVSLGILLFVAGTIPFARFLYFFFADHVHGLRHIQSLLIGSVLLTASFISFTLGIVADLIRINRVLIEESLEQEKRLRFDIDRLAAFKARRK
ncbi:MAG TPA: glycosyltransferase family 2 protein [Candidatus Saccharimonadales bacterium]|nr:glycosyltransferase family 2 protein [Candidatus Saccharimonadales bacterium]